MGGGVIIMDSIQYVDKLNELLADIETYEKKANGFSKKQGQNFNKKARKILRKTEKGKTFTHLLEEAPRAPRLRGLPKVHKLGIPITHASHNIGHW